MRTCKLDSQYIFCLYHEISLFSHHYDVHTISPILMNDIPILVLFYYLWCQVIFWILCLKSNTWLFLYTVRILFKNHCYWYYIGVKYLFEVYIYDKRDCNFLYVADCHILISHLMLFRMKCGKVPTLLLCLWKEQSQ